MQPGLPQETHACPRLKPIAEGQLHLQFFSTGIGTPQGTNTCA
jgi:hypothetical protein